MSETPNSNIDSALRKLMKQIDDKSTPLPPDTAVKVINAAIAWEKVKHRILDSGEDFDPDSL